MTAEEAATLRNDLLRLHALLIATADMCSTVGGNDPKVERTQALLDVAVRYGAQALLTVEAAISRPALQSVTLSK